MEKISVLQQVIVSTQINYHQVELKIFHPKYSNMELLLRFCDDLATAEKTAIIIDQIRNLPVINKPPVEVSFDELFLHSKNDDERKKIVDLASNIKRNAEGKLLVRDEDFFFLLGSRYWLLGILSNPVFQERFNSRNYMVLEEQDLGFLAIQKERSFFSNFVKNENNTFTLPTESVLFLLEQWRELRERYENGDFYNLQPLDSI
jgi:hypothetical protein